MANLTSAQVHQALARQPGVRMLRFLGPGFVALGLFQLLITDALVSAMASVIIGVMTALLGVETLRRSARNVVQYCGPGTEWVVTADSITMTTQHGTSTSFWSAVTRVEALPLVVLFHMIGRGMIMLPRAALTA